MEEVLAIPEAPVEELWERRIRAAAVFMFLSGIRVGAFVTLPLKTINIERRNVNQWPSLGVKTKNQKRSTTYLLNIPELLRVIREWDNLVRPMLPPNGYWFAPL